MASRAVPRWAEPGKAWDQGLIKQDWWQEYFMCLFSWSEQGFVSISHYSVCCLIRLRVLCVDLVCFLRSEECWYIFQDCADCAESILHSALPLCLQKCIWLPCLETFRSCASSKQVASWCYSFLVWHHQRNFMENKPLGCLCVGWIFFFFPTFFWNKHSLSWASFWGREVQYWP